MATITNISRTFVCEQLNGNGKSAFGNFTVESCGETGELSVLFSSGNHFQTLLLSKVQCELLAGLLEFHIKENSNANE